MKKMHKIGILCILAGLLTGCSSSIITTAHVTQPVMLGQIMRIQVNEPEIEQRKQKVPFNIRIVNFGVIGQDFSYHIDADVDLLKHINSPQDQVIVDEIRVGSDSFFLFLPTIPLVRNSSEISIIGGIYRAKKGDLEKK